VTLIPKSPIFTVRAVILMVFEFMDADRIAAIVHFHRKKSGLSQAELAKLAGLGKTVIFDIEKRKRSVRLDTLLKVLNVLNIKMEFQSQLMVLFKESLNEES
jgi:HTH-type transcriptional regulator/antitoxin HipB